MEGFLEEASLSVYLSVFCVPGTDSQPVVICAPRGHLTMSGDIFGRDDLGSGYYQHLIYRMSPPQYLAQMSLVPRLRHREMDSDNKL